MADLALPVGEQILALATKHAIQAAGGLSVCASETDLSDSHLSRCSLPNHRDSITIRDAATIESIGHGHAGHPFILHALARVIGGHVVVRLPSSYDDEAGLVASTLELTTELGDVSRAIGDAMSSSGAGGARITPAEARLVEERLDDLDRASARMRHRLRAIAEEGKAKT
ncbi:phage regulatory CII family protein [Sphingomonas sp. Leaf4]|uniref:phage regulatory CII family protein n=1 Tax=Sphingomonas sp. Leaf4 TaxID=2876553 RepID=UPI001E382484|nr:phage regulatory CII family protein [Sphingomonas sp. Leaf4]